MNTAHEILARTKLLLATEAQWTQGTSVVMGAPGEPPKARCLGYALAQACGQLGAPCGVLMTGLNEARAAVIDAIGGESIPSWNDNGKRVLADVHCVLDQAMVTIRQGQGPALAARLLVHPGAKPGRPT